MERLQKVISRAGLASRREAEKLIAAGKVSVNGETVTELGTKVDARDRIAVEGKPIKAQSFKYFLLYKPKGVITSAKDERGRKTVLDLLEGVEERVYPVGRLDYNTEGALLLTNDGDLTNRLIHPSYEIRKTYIAKVRGIPSEETLDKLRAGVVLDDGPTAPALVDVTDIDREKGTLSFEITIHEGRNRQIRRMCDAIGYPVRSLRRVRFANLTLEGLRRGQYRALTSREIEALKGGERLQDRRA